MQAALSLSLVLCDKFGSALWFGFGFTLLAVFFVPFLPAWAKSTGRENILKDRN